jgi:hypothetical protein
MAIDVNLAASHITASLISSDSISVKGSNDQDTIKNGSGCSQRANELGGHKDFYEPCFHSADPA